MEIYFKTDMGFDALAQTLRETLNLPDRNRLPYAIDQKRHGSNRGGDYYLFEAFGLELNLLRNIGEVAVPERAEYPYYLFAEASLEADLEMTDCITRQIYTVMHRKGLEVELASLAI
jgi:hypothetical protein